MCYTYNIEHVEFKIDKIDLLNNDLANVIYSKANELLPPMYQMTGNWRYSPDVCRVSYNIYVEIKRLIENGGQYLLF